MNRPTLVLALVLLALLASAGPAAPSAQAQEPSADLAAALVVTSPHPRVARDGAVVTFAASATNRGPSVTTIDFTIGVSDSFAQLLNAITCPAGGILIQDGCRYEAVAPGATVTMDYFLVALAGAGPSPATTTACASSPDTPDPILANNCATAAVMIVGKR